MPANLTIWSESSLGRSWNSSNLNVPILTNANQRQPQDVFYDDNTKSIRWVHPKDKNNLIGYTLHWCRMSSTNSSNCANREPMLSFTLYEYRTSFQFGKSMARYHMAVVANYRDHEIRGALVWSTPAPAESIVHLVVIVGSVMLIFLALYALCFKIYQKIQYMADIEVKLPDIHPMETLQKSRDDHSFHKNQVKNPARLNAPAPPPPLPVSSAVSISSPLVVGYTVMNYKFIKSSKN